MRRALISAVLVGTGGASAHQAPAGWDYDPACCSSMDCARVGDEAVREVAGGFEVVLPPGSHPLVRAGSAGVRVFVRHGDPRIRPSGDQHRHACVASSSNHVYCIYVPSGGV